MTVFLTWLPAILMLVLLVVRTPITWAIAVAALSFYLLNGNMVPLASFAQEMVEGSQSISLLALPSFVLAGCIMNASGITRRLVRIAEVLVGHMTGALAQMCTVLATLLGGLTASANADAAMLAKTIGVQMVEHKYSPAFAAVITSSASIITSLIPPSIGLIIYGYLAEVSVGRLFAAGIVPGLVFALGLMVVTYVTAVRRGYQPQRTTRASGREVASAVRDGLWAMSIPVIIFLGTRYGIFTTTESGAVIVVYVLFVAVVGYREFRLRQVPMVISEAVRDTSSVMMMICAAGALGFYLAWEAVPQSLTGWLSVMADNPLLLLIFINFILIILGTVIEGSSALIILTPMLIPLIGQAHIDKVHFGILLVTNLTIAGVTPPVGGLMYIASQVLKVKMEDYTREVIPYLAMMFVLLALMTCFPQIALWLPDLIYGNVAVQ